MDHASEVALIHRILRHVRAGGTDRADRETRHRAADYLDRSRFDAEAGAITRRAPFIVAHRSQLGRPGDYVTESVLGVPVAVVRGADGVLRAFLNVCRHRAAQLLTEGHGSGLRAIVCPYHAWSYDLSGRLTVLPDRADSFPEVDTGRLGLVALPVAERHGFVWVSLTPGPSGTADLDGFLGPLDAELAGLGLAGHTYYTGESQQRGFNWKTGVEAFLENYHFATLHKRTTSRIFLNNLTVVDTFGPHVRAVAPKRSITSLAGTPEQAWSLRPHATVLYVIFPGTCLFVEKTHASLLQVFPEAPDRSRVKISHVVAKDGLRYRDFYDRNIALFTSAVVEDLDMCESMATGLAAAPDQEIVFGRNEVGCTAFRTAVDRALAAPPAGPPSPPGHTPSAPATAAEAGVAPANGTAANGTADAAAPGVWR